MAWLQIKIQTTDQFAEVITNYLNLLGAVSISYLDAADEPILEPDLNTMPLWQKINLLALFEDNIDPNQIKNFINQQIQNSILEFHSEILSDKNWERAWLEDFKPLKFGKNLWICPSVMEPIDPKAVNIILDPGLAFGTGTHPTTALCLEWLADNPPIDKMIIDYGCGSGILAIAALKLGAKEAWAVDYDEQALESTLENAKRNNIDLTKLKVYLPEDLPKIKSDILIANILAQPLVDLAPKFVELLKPKNIVLVLSGILQDQTELVTKAYKNNFNLPEVSSKEEWVRLVFKI